MTYFDLFLSLSWFRTVLVLVVVYLVSYYGLKQRRNLPPGPWSVSLLGNIPLLALKLYRSGKDPEQLLAEMAKKYGKVFSLKIGWKLLVVINGYKSIKEISQDPRVNDRPKSTVFEETKIDEAIIFTSGKSWKYQRSFMLNTFRSFGIGRSRFESNIAKEAQTLVEIMSATKGKPFDPHILIGNCVSNVVCSVVLGRRYGHSDAEFKHLLLLLKRNVQEVGPGTLVVFLPILKYILPKRYDSVKSALSEFVSFIRNIVDEHRHTFDKDNMRDIVDVFLNEIEVAKTENGDRGNYIQLESLLATTTFLFMAGTETTTSTLLWAFLYMVKYPEIQAMVQREMDEVIGRTRMPQWTDTSVLPYTEAVLLEVQRIRTVIALSLPRVVTEDTKLAGYDIPNGTFVVFNHWAVHNDPDVWAQPEQFRPERFLDGNGKLQHREELMPFSKGHRVCLGENLAKMEIFLFFTYVLHSLTISNPSDVTAPSMKGIAGVAMGPTPFNMVIKERNIIKI